MMMNRVLIPIFIAVVLASSAITTAEESNPSLFQWPSFTNHHHDSATLIKKFQCGASVHNVYACLRKSFINIHGHKHNLLGGVTDCCSTVRDFHDRCSGFQIGKLESFLFPAVFFKQCSAADPPAPASAPAGPAADIEV